MGTPTAGFPPILAAELMNLSAPSAKLPGNWVLPSWVHRQPRAVSPPHQPANSSSVSAATGPLPPVRCSICPTQNHHRESESHLQGALNHALLAAPGHRACFNAAKSLPGYCLSRVVRLDGFSLRHISPPQPRPDASRQTHTGPPPSPTSSISCRRLLRAGDRNQPSARIYFSRPSSPSSRLASRPSLTLPRGRADFGPVLPRVLRNPLVPLRYELGPRAMEAAAKTVELLTQRTLPDTPYYLSNHPDWRYRPRPDDHLRPEEWHSTRLQYSTLLAEADRGVLLTRPDYDMREEPSKPVARDMTALSKAGGEKKKLSLSDYKNKKTAAASPPEPAVSRLRESERAGASPSKSLASSGTRPADDARTSIDPRRSLDARPSDARKDRSRDPIDGKQRPKDFNLVDMSLPAKPPLKNYPLPPRPPSPGSKKRVADHEDARPQKRSRPENTRPNDDRLPNRDDPVRKRNPLLQGANHRDSPLLNGKSSLPGGSALNKGASPANRYRGDSVNGGHPATVGRHTPKQESPKKPVVPPLLSPLRLGPGYDDDSLLKQDRRRADGTPPRPKKPEQPAEEKKRKLTRSLPALLSPTLPPIIEAALRQREQGSPEPDERPKEKKALAAKRRKSFSADESLDEMPGHHAELIVTLKVPKGLRKSFRRVMALPTANPSSHGRDRDRDRSHKDRDRSTDNDRQYAQKRLSAAPEADSGAMKKSRSSDIPNASRRPRTPPRKSHTSMSRVNSNTVTAHTPGESMRRTPSSTGTGDKRPNGVAPAKLDINELREKEERLRVTGKRLKHEAERAFKARHSAMANSKDSQPRIASDGHTTSPVKVGFMRALESILCFMHAFQAQDLRNIEAGRKIDIQIWTSLFPLIDYYLLELQPPHSARPAFALLLMLQMFTTDHILTSILAQPPRPDLNKAIIEHERVRNRALGQIREAYALIDNPRLRADISPWWSLDDVTETTLRVMRRWCAEEDVTWAPELTPRDYGR